MGLADQHGVCHRREGGDYAADHERRRIRTSCIRDDASQQRSERAAEVAAEVLDGADGCHLGVVHDVSGHGPGRRLHGGDEPQRHGHYSDGERERIHERDEADQDAGDNGGNGHDVALGQQRIPAGLLGVAGHDPAAGYAQDGRTEVRDRSQPAGICDARTALFLQVERQEDDEDVPDPDDAEETGHHAPDLTVLEEAQPGDFRGSQDL